MIKSIFIILGIVLFIWFLLPVFSFLIVNIGNITGMAVGLVLFFYGIFFRQFNHFIGWFWNKGAGRVIEIVIGVCILAIIVLAVMTTVCMIRGMLVPKETLQAESDVQKTVTGGKHGNGMYAGESESENIPKNIVTGQPENEMHTGESGPENITDNSEKSIGGNKKTVIVLGCKTIGERPSLMLEERLQAAYDYLAEHPDINAIVSGGQGEDETVAEAEVMFNWLVDRGIAPERIYKEARSTDTHENLAYCYDILLEQASNAKQTGALPDADQVGAGGEDAAAKKTEAGSEDAVIKTEAGGEDAAAKQTNGGRFKVVLVTNEFHEYRALRIAASYGFDAEPLPAKTAWWLFPTYYVREMYGILEDWFLVR